MICLHNSLYTGETIADGHLCKHIKLMVVSPSLENNDHHLSALTDNVFFYTWFYVPFLIFTRYLDIKFLQASNENGIANHFDLLRLLIHNFW